MSVASPESLAEVPQFHHQKTLEVVQFGTTALGNIAARTYDPTTGEYGDSLRVIHTDLTAVLDDVYGKVSGVMLGTEAIVRGLATGAAGETLQRAGNSVSLNSAIHEIGRGPAGVQAALRAGLDRQVFDEAVQGVSLNYGVHAIANYGSTHGKRAMRLGLEQRVYLEAFGAVSINSGAHTIANYAANSSALRRGLDLRVAHEAATAVSLNSATHTIANYGSSPIDQRHMRNDLDQQVESEAMTAVSLNSATHTIANYGSTQAAKDSMREKLNTRVRSEAADAHSASSALQVVRGYGFGPQKTVMEQEVAQKWLPSEKAKLAEQKKTLAKTEQELDDISELNIFKRAVKFPASQRLKAKAKLYEMLISSTKASVTQLSGILGIEDQE